MPYNIHNIIVLILLVFYQNECCFTVCLRVQFTFCTEAATVIFQCGRLVLLHLLAPRVRRYFPADVLAALEPPAPTPVDGMLTLLYTFDSVLISVRDILHCKLLHREFLQIELTQLPGH